MHNPPSLLAGQTGLIMGVANEHSLAHAIATTAHAAGAKLILTFPNASIEKRLRPIAESLGATVFPADVSSDAQLKTLANELGHHLGDTKLDFVVHAVAFAPKEDLQGPLSLCSREGFATTLDVSCYSFIALLQHLAPHLARSASIVTLTYLGSTRVIPNYHLMGVAKAALEAAVRYLAAEVGPLGQRVNAISAGPINTLAARGIKDFPAMLKQHEQTAPLRRLTSPGDVAKAALYLLSDLSAGVTGEVHMVDTGANILGPSGNAS